MSKRVSLQAELDDLVAQSLNVTDRIDAEDRDMTEEEVSRLDEWNDRIQLIKNQLRLIEQADKNANALSASTGRKSDSVEVGGSVQNSRVTASEAFERSPTYGFKNFGEFAVSVRNAALPGGLVDNRLKSIKNAPTEFGAEKGDLGIAVPEEFAQTIMKKVGSEDSLLGRCRRLTTSAGTVTELVDEEEPWASTGVKVYWEGEGVQKNQSRPNLKRITHYMDKIYALVPMTDDLLEDAPLLQGHLNTIAPERIDFAISRAIFNGNGVGKPLGVMNAGALISVAKESGQAADTFMYENANNMWGRLAPSCRQNAIWLIDSDVETQLNLMVHPAGGATTTVPVYMPPSGAASTPYSTLFGRPVIVSEVTEALGDKGDVLLVDFSKYTVWTKGGMRSDVSMHLWFDYDMTAFRFTMRMTGQPTWKSAISKRAGSRTVSCFVTLDERA